MIVPAPGFILIEILDDDEKTDQGIYLPQDLQMEPMRGKVLAVGDRRKTEYGTLLESPALTGDTIFFKPHTVQELPGYAEKKQGFIPFEVVMGFEVEEKV